MDKREKFIKVMSSIDNDLLEEAQKYDRRSENKAENSKENKNRRVYVTRYLAMAACLCIIVFSGIGIGNSLRSEESKSKTCNDEAYLMTYNESDDCSGVLDDKGAVRMYINKENDGFGSNGIIRPATIANPYMDSCKEQFEELGYEIHPVLGAEDIQWFLISGEEEIAEVCFTYDDAQYNLRESVNGRELDISGVYEVFTNEEKVNVGSKEGTLYFGEPEYEVNDNKENKFAVILLYDEETGRNYSMFTMDFKDVQTMCNVVEECFK